MAIISWVVFSVLLVIAVIHALWGMGVIWPFSSEQHLVNAVVGAKGMTQMPRADMTLVIAFLIGMSGVWARVLSGHWLTFLPQWFVVLAGVALSLVFIGRGAVGYLPAWQELTSVEPFLTLNYYYYSPLCLLLGSGFTFLTVQAIRQG